VLTEQPKGQFQQPKGHDDEEDDDKNNNNNNNLNNVKGSCGNDHDGGDSNIF
jgi:hypothetical protein